MTEPQPKNVPNIASSIDALTEAVMGMRPDRSWWERLNPAVEMILFGISATTLVLLCLQMRDLREQISLQAAQNLTSQDELLSQKHRDYWEVRGSLLGIVYEQEESCPPGKRMCSLDSAQDCAEPTCPPRSALRLRQNAANALIDYFQSPDKPGWIGKVPLSHARLRYLAIVASRDMANTQFYAADLRCAYLDGAEAGGPIDFSGANFQYADLRGASFGRSILTDVKWRHAQCPDGVGAGDKTGCVGHLSPINPGNCGVELYSSVKPPDN